MVVGVHSVHLVALLEVLVSPHVGRDGGGQGVVRQLLCPLGENRVSVDVTERLKGEHGLNYCTQLST